MKTVRTLRPEDLDQARPIYTVWELTLRCDHACAHCGSRAGPSATRSDELATAELLEVAASLVRLGTREVTIIGGEAYLRPDVYEIVAYLHENGIRVTMQTGGMAFTPERARRFKEAGLAAIGVSVDGPPAIHDLLRARPGSHAAALRALDAAHALGMITTVNTQVNRLNKDHLRETCELLRARGIRVWRPQLTVPMGRAFHVLAGNNVGYYGPHEQLLRSRPGGNESWWNGCGAGKHVLGIESDGVVKGCPSLPTAPYTGGNVRDLSLEAIWETAPELAFTRARGTEELWGFCKGCYYADVCKAGCSFTAHCTLGKRGNNPFCYYRADTLKKAGKRERLVPVEAAGGVPYDFGRFEVIEEAWGGE